ncbi:hypothetical protein PF586_06835 [Lactobacillus delbrueckii]|uniref:DUF8208 domain-containing protein n=2 Tax=Lactobacillus delbrueckii TaxID=1584 RepID=A0AAW5YVV6_9LACO|nr:hypothetical protein [Lactobacillus delbrueckii]MDA3768172.1 hypothetical protein [Lactobacillus delbrueckii]
MYPFNSIKWAIVEFFYGMANFSSKVLEKVIGTNSFITKGLTGKGALAPWVESARNAAWAIIVAYLVWVGVKMVISKEPPRMKNVLLQLVTSIFLIISMGSISTMLVKQSVSWYNGITGISKNGKKASTDTSSLAYNVIKNNTNDIQYIITTDFGTLNTSKKNKSNLSNPLISKKGKNYYGTIMDKVPKVKYGYNVLTKSQLDQGKVQLDEILNWKNIDLKSNIADVAGTDTDLGKADKKKFDDLNEDWEEGKHLSLRMLWYQLETYTDAGGKTQIESPDIGRIGTTIFAFGGYPRFQIDFWPTIITLAAITVAYFFAGYAIIKSFLELGLMNILGIFIFAVDLDSGNKTKQVVQAIFSTSLLVALQGLEIAFYQIAMTFGQTAKNDGTFGSGATAMWGYVLFALVATTLLITGSQRVTDFFGVDTGAQHGMRGLGGAMYAASKVGHGLKRAATAPGRAANDLKNMRDDIGRTLNTEGSMKRDAKKQAKEGARQDAINKMAGVDAYGNKVNSAGESGEKISDLNALRGNGGDTEGNANAGSEAENESPIDQNDAENEEAENKKPDGSGIQQTPAAKKAMEKAYAKAQKASDHAQRNARLRKGLAAGVLTAAGLSQPDGSGQGQMPSSMTSREAQEALDKAGVAPSPATQAAMAKVDKAQAAYDQAVANGDANAPQLKQELDGAKKELAQSTTSDIQNAQLPSSMSTGQAQKALEAAGVSASPATQVAMQKVDQAQAVYDQAVANGDANAPQLKQELDGAKKELAQSTASDIKSAQAVPAAKGITVNEARRALDAGSVKPSQATQAAMQRVEKAQAAYDKAVSSASSNAPQLKQELSAAKQELAKTTANDIKTAPARGVDGATAKTMLKQAGAIPSEKTSQLIKQTTQAKTEWRQAVANGSANAPELKQKVERSEVQLAKSVNQDIGSSVAGKATTSSATTTKQTVSQTATSTAAGSVTQQVQQNVHENVSQAVQSKPGQAGATTTTQTINQTGTTQASQPVQQNVHQNVNQTVQAKPGQTSATTTTQTINQTGSVSAGQPTHQNVTQNITQNVRETGGSGVVNQTQNVSRKVQPGQTEKPAPSEKSRSDAPIAEKPTNGTNAKDFSTPKSPTDKQ